MKCHGIAYHGIHLQNKTIGPQPGPDQTSIQGRLSFKDLLLRSEYQNQLVLSNCSSQSHSSCPRPLNQVIRSRQEPGLRSFYYLRQLELTT